MTPEPPLTIDLDALKTAIATEATSTVSRFWWAEAQKVAEQINDPATRWEILLLALRQVGWPSE